MTSSPSQRIEGSPLSFAQERLWFTEQLQPGNCAYNISAVVRLAGPLNTAVLEKSLGEIVRRHEVLRTTFGWVDENPVQAIAAPKVFHLPLVDLSVLPMSQRTRRAKELADQEDCSPFDLVKGPLFRATLVRMGVQEHELLLTMHHIVSDGWSLGVLFEELSVLYAAFQAGKASPLPELPMQYADYARWQRQWLQGEVLATQLEYWKKQLSGELPMLELPSDRPRPPVQSFRGGSTSLRLPPGLQAELRSLGRKEGVTLFMMLLAAFQTLLHRYTGQDKIIVGTPVAGRNRVETEKLMGFFVNTLVLRTDLSGNPTFRELLSRVSNVCLEAYAHQDLPFERLVQDLQIERSLSHTPVFNVMLNMVNLPAQEIRLSEVRVELPFSAPTWAKFDLTLYVYEEAQGPNLVLVYNADLFEPQRMSEMLEQLKHLIGQMVEAPDKTIRSYSLVTPRTRNLLPDPAVMLDEPRYDLVTGVFASWANWQPDHVAIRQEERSWTYAELLSAARGLAGTLLAQPFGPADVVAVMGPRSFGLISSMLAALLSGKVLLPVDRSLPANRQKLMLKEADVQGLIYVGAWRKEDDWLHEDSKLVLIQLDPNNATLLPEGRLPNPQMNQFPEPAPDDPAYIFFTSGTTGTPKGVLGCHKGLSHFLAWQRDTFAVGPQDRCAQLTNLSFDVVLRDIFLPLVSGATLCLPDESEDLTPDRVLRWLEREAVTLLHTVPSLAQSWLGGVPHGVTHRGPRRVFFAGEPLSGALVRRWREVFPGSVQIINLYGPTETTLVKCFQILPAENAEGVQPVGRPLPQTQALVLTRDGQLCGIGEPGEIVLRTPFRTLGYINAPEEQRRLFVRNPFRNDPRDLLYRTGDRGRYRTDGSLDVFGRLDHQVKIRGVRVEPDEVTATLSGHPSVRSCVVIGRKDASEECRLVAYVVAASADGATLSALRSYLQAQLPAALVPSFFVFLDTLPLTPNGKVDRRALPAPEPTRPELKEAFVAPGTPTEDKVAKVWGAVFNLDQIGIHDNFFDLGGHSLLASRVISRLRQAFNLELPLRILFEQPTVAELAGAIDQGLSEGRGSTEIHAVPGQRRGPSALSFAQERLWFIEQFQPGNCAYNIPLAVRLAGPLDVAALEKSLREIVRRHEALRTTFGWIEENPVQMVAAPGAFCLPLVDLTGLPPGRRIERAQELARQETRSPFDLTNGPLFRATLVRTGVHEHELLLTMHHIVSDGWSLGVLFEELSGLYAAFQAGKASPLPELPMQYADYACWQRQWLQGEILAKQLGYWKQQLSGELPTLELASDRPRPPVQTFQGASQSLRLRPGLQAELRSLGRREGVTLFMTLLAVFETLLHRYTAQDRTIVGMPIANRDQIETEGLIGFFANTLALPADLSGNPTFRELLGRIRRIILDAKTHQDLPFEELVRELQPERDLSRTPLFQVMFLLHDAARQILKMPGLSASYVRSPTETAKFDLTLLIIESAQGLEATLEYRTDLFDQDTITRMLAHFQVLLDGIVADPDRRIAHLPLLTEVERKQLLVDWNDTGKQFPNELCIHQLFEAQVGKTPEAVALTFEDKPLTYRELNERANQLANYLRQRGVGPEVLVGLYLERSLDMVIGLLGILKAGGAYVPLDPSYPVERLAFMVKDSQAALLLSQARHREKLREYAGAVVSLDSDWNIISLESTDNPSRAAAANNLAYVLYTSGSTGKPKGVCIEHRSVVARLQWAKGVFDSTEIAGVLASTSICFDLSVFELFVPLSWGGKVILAENILQLLGLPARADVTLINTVPSAMTELLRLEGVPAGVKVVNMAGEPLTAALADRIYQQTKVQKVFDLYGPTEDTVYSMVAPRKPGGPATIGRPIHGTQVYILDRHLNPVPIGVHGELYLGGDGLARNYWNRGELTAERFIANPFAGKPGARLYQTGDRVRYRPDGTIEFLGRVDQQVKVRGYRIELGEIETLLNQHVAFTEAVVVVREDSPGDQRLVAYLVCKEAPPVSALQLREYLEQKLPDYMVPSAFVFIDHLPLTPNGKMDRRALPALGLARPEMQETFVAPATPTQEKVAEVWGGVFRLDRIGVRDNFFELGGHSLLATQVISRLRRMFHLKLPLRILFEKPTVAGLAEAIDRESFGERGSPEVQVVPIRHREHSPLSFAQEGLWFVEQFQPGNSAYNIPLAVRLTGPLNVSALEQSLGEIVRRHEILRTTFGWVDENPVQVVAAPGAFCLDLLDLSVLPPGHRAERARALASQEARTPFDLAKGPLFRATLVQMGVHEHELLLTMHHIVSDGWSLGLLFEELSVLYGAFQAGKASPLPELPMQYADYACWQRQWLQGEVLAKQLEHWKQPLGGELPMLELPSDRPRPPVQSFRGASQSLRLHPVLAEKLRSLGQREGATLFMTLLAAFQTLLHRYTAQDKIIVGTPIANRNQIETERLIGFFANTLALPVDLSGNPTFRELLMRIRRITLDAYAHQDLPFEELVRELQPERDLSRTPVFEVMFVLHNSPRPELKLPGLTARYLGLATDTAKFDLTLSMVRSAEGLEGRLEYRTDLFDADTVARMLANFQILLQGIVANPDQPIAQLPLLTEVERRQLLVDWNDTGEEFSNELCIHQLFEAQVEQTPEAVAVTFEGNALTYLELNERANQLAHSLRKHGVGPEKLAVLYMERSLEMVIGLLGILKAGGAYVPLDPSYPQERLALLLDDVQADVLVTQSRLAEKLPDYRGKVVCLENELETNDPAAQTNPVSGVKPHNLAYVIYTSGSSGCPKGVTVTHDNVVRLFTQTKLWFEFGASDVWTLFHSYAFDFSVWEFWGALFHGGKLVIVPYWISRSPEEFLRLLRVEKVTVLNQTPSAFRQLMQAEAAGDSSELSLRFVIFGGEALEPGSLKSWFARHGDKKPQLVNMYGITETTVHVTYRVLTMADASGSVGSVIGKPIADLQVHLLDKHLQLVPIGVPGEIYVGGAGLARGYLNSPHLTSERFLPHPFDPRAGARLYRTGDRARYFANGDIEYLGRTDYQVKIRGFRIELGEIETLLVQHPRVREAVVIAREDSPGDQRLTAYLVCQESATLSPFELREYLKHKLPDYMVPAAFVFLDRLPLTPNGKLNRAALPAPSQSGGPDASATPPRTPIEQRLAEIWLDVLRIPRVGIHDNFFELGGHSLLATRIISRIRQVFQMEIPLSRLFGHPTIVGMAEIIEAAKGTKRSSPSRPTRRGSQDGPLALSFAQQRLWFLHQLAPSSPVYNIRSALRLRGLLSLQALQKALDAVVDRHESLRTVFIPSDGKPAQMILAAAPVSWSMIDLSELPAAARDAELRQILQADEQGPFNLEQGPLLRTTLVRFGETEHILLLTVHHVVTDGWSMSVLFKELAVYYEAFLRLKPALLAPLSIQYADFAHWQREWLQGEVLDSQLAFWKKQLGGRLPVLELPTDRPRPADPSFSGARHAFAIDRSLTEALKVLARQRKSTLYMALLAAFQTLLHRYSQQEDILVGSPFAGRVLRETEDLIGFFVNTLVMRADLAGNPTFRQLLERVREAALGAYAHQNLPFEKLVEELHPERSRSLSPIFQVMFALQNVPAESPAFEGLAVTRVPLNSRTAKFDLTLTLADGDDGLHGSFEYNTDLFDSTTIVRMAGHFLSLLEGIAANPDQRIAELPLLTEVERKQLLMEWNDTTKERPGAKLLHQLFEAQAGRTPEAVAVVFEEEKLPYGELNRRADQLASHLRRLGVGPGALVGLFLDRSLELVVGLLGVLKAGGAYVPLDPLYPEERLAFMIRDAGVAVLLTQAALAPRLAGNQAVVLRLDQDWERIEAEKSTSSSLEQNCPEDLAYVIYTSGSTGKPKGVMIAHRAICNHMHWMQRVWPLTPGDVVLQKTPFSFDASVWEFYAPLLAGGRLIMARPGGHADSAYLVRSVIEHNVSILQLVPSVLRLLLNEPAFEQCRSLKRVFCGGEALTTDLQERFFERLPTASLHNLYGPTEAAIDSTSWTCRRETGARTIPIGSPIDNTQAYILDARLQPTPVGVPGELCIGGEGLARGYLNQPELTAEKFIANPFAANPGTRLYRTGDRVRYLADGAIEFLGRMDHQVKVRGFRIELGEIESLLVQHAAVRDALAVVREDRPGDQKLVAYVVMRPEQKASEGELRSYLGARLPDYMVPSVFVLLEALPLLPNGKVDRAALPWPDPSRTQITDATVGPLTPFEAVLVQIWAEVLGLERVGVHDNFFALGGHSLIATQIISRVRDAFQVELPLRTLFQAPTVGELALILVQEMMEAASPESPDQSQA